nr:protein ENHANCED DISEASE RESISTANCE 4-like [Ipomoea batatas]GMD77810.1 protein ENHANCED DISEASE RESISTANCE 4-like [Ipomoea batatas]
MKNDTVCGISSKQQNDILAKRGSRTAKLCGISPRQQNDILAKRGSRTAKRMKTETQRHLIGAISSILAMRSEGANCKTYEDRDPEAFSRGMLRRKSKAHHQDMNFTPVLPQMIQQVAGAATGSNLEDVSNE